MLRLEPLMSNNRLCLMVLVMNDSVLEEEQTFSVVLSTADLDITLQSNPAVVTIVDNDGIFANGCCVWFYCLHALMSIWLCYRCILYYIFFFSSHYCQFAASYVYSG